MIRLMTTACAALVTTALQAQPAACAANKPGLASVCNSRIGHCVQVQLDGLSTRPLIDAAMTRSLDVLRLRGPVCWTVDQPVSTQFRIAAQAGGLNAQWLGRLQSVGVNVYPIDDFDPKLDSRLESLSGVRVAADGYRDGTWQINAQTPLRPGRYVLEVRIAGSANWDLQSVLVTVDPARSASPAQMGSP
jgi:hypothetical protein